MTRLGWSMIQNTDPSYLNPDKCYNSASQSWYILRIYREICDPNDWFAGFVYNKTNLILLYVLTELQEHVRDGLPSHKCRKERWRESLY